MSYNPMGGATYSLQSSISSTQTTITLSSFKVPVTEDNITMALMNTDVAYGTIAPKTSASEFISFTGITQNADGTATLTGVTRGLNKTYPFTEDSDFKLPHSGQSTFILSDAPQVFNSYAALDNDNIFTGQNEVPTPLDDGDIANKLYVDTIVNGGVVSNNRIVVAGVAGSSMIAAGELVYQSTSDGRWYKTDADTATTVYGVTLGIAQGAGTVGNNITDGVLTEGVDTLNTGTAGNTAYISNTAGALSTSAGTHTRAVGVYIPGAAGLYFNPNLVNKYPQNVTSVYAADSVGTDSYAITLSPAPGAYTTGMEVSFKAGTANTGSCTLNVNSLGAKTIKKFGTFDTVTGDIVVGQIVTVVYDGTGFQMQTPTSPTMPVTTTYSTAGTSLGSSTTQFDITNTSGTTYRYTWDSTGTDPSFSAANNPVGSLIYFSAQNFTAANNGLFVVTGSGTNYVEVTNASGVVESNKTIGTGTLARVAAASGTYTKPANLKYIEIQAVGGGGGGSGGVSSSYNGMGGGGGGYAKKIISASSLSATEYFIVGYAGAGGASTASGVTGGTTVFGISGILVCTGGQLGTVSSSPGTGGTATGGDINISGVSGFFPYGDNSGGGANVYASGAGGSSLLGAGGKSAVTAGNGNPGLGYGGGGSGGFNTGSGGGAGTTGAIIITEYYI